MNTRLLLLLLVCFALGACSQPQAIAPSSTPSATPTASLTPTIPATSSPTAAVSESTPTVGSDETATPEADLTYIPGTTKESDFPLTDKDEMWSMLCSLEGIVVPETPIPYGDTGYVITAYAEKCKFGEGKAINNLVIGLRNPADHSEILFGSVPKQRDVFAAPWVIKQFLENAYFTEGRRVLIYFGRKNPDNAVWLLTDDYAADVINAQPNLEEFAQTGDPSLLGEWLIPGLVYPQVSTQEVN